MFASKDLFFSKPSGYQISRSVRLRSSASAYLNRTNGTPTSTTTTTLSLWLKRGTIGIQNNILGAGQASGTNYSQFTFDSGSALIFSESGTPSFNLTTTQVFRDPSAWYHIVFVYDSTQATASNRAKIYVNGVQVTAFSTANYPALNQATYFNTNAYIKAIGNIWYNGAPGGFYFDGYLTEVNFIDGQALTPSSFGQTNTITGVWQPLKYTGTYGTNGFYLNFSDNSNNTATTIGKDYSGNGNNWTPNNISVTNNSAYDSMLDVPTLFADGGNGRGNYPILNVLRDKAASLSVINGNLTISSTAAAWNSQAASILIPTSGKWYWECEVGGAGNEYMIGITGEQSALSGQYPGQANGYGYYRSGQKFTASTGSAYGASYTSGDVIGVAVDVDAGTLTFYKNGTSQGVAFSSGISSNPSPSFAVNGTTASNLHPNFGQRPFAYTPPTGFKALNTQNLPSPAILKGNQYFDANPYTGNGTSVSVTNGGFQPDFVWLKERGGANQHNLIDSVRGASFRLRTDGTGAEEATPGTFTFNSSGFTANTTNVSFNGNTQTYASWQWNAGGSTVTNTNGSISAQVRANTTAGFSVVTWTGNGVSTATIGHGLGVQPSMVITKSRSGVNDWWVGHKGIPNATTSILILNSTGAVVGSLPTYWNSTAPSSTVFSLGSDANINGTNAAGLVAYCFAAVPGYSAFGRYTGNGSSDGPFVYLGFRPRYIMVKKSSDVSNWQVLDSSRSPYNLAGEDLLPNSSDAEKTIANGFNQVDFLSNGFKIRNTNCNDSGGTYIYACFAETPLAYSNAR